MMLGPLASVKAQRSFFTDAAGPYSTLHGRPSRGPAGEAWTGESQVGQCPARTAAGAVCAGAGAGMAGLTQPRSAAAQR